MDSGPWGKKKGGSSEGLGRGEGRGVEIADCTVILVNYAIWFGKSHATVKCNVVVILDLFSSLNPEFEHLLELNLACCCCCCCRCCVYGEELDRLPCFFSGKDRNAEWILLGG